MRASVQVAWFREFRLLFGARRQQLRPYWRSSWEDWGSATPSWGRRRNSVKNPLAWYALLELSIATAAALSPLLIDLLDGLYILLGGELALGVPLATAARLVISAIVLGGATFLMGGTLPAAVRAVTKSEDHQRRGAALLYGANTLGAVVGALASTFFALEFFGTRETLWLACLVNLCTAVIALALSRPPASRPLLRNGARPARSQMPIVTRQMARKAARSRVHAAHQPSVPKPPPISFPAYVVYAVAGAAGFVFFLMELVWYRMLGPILGGTTFTFGLILAVALAGIGLGGMAYAMFFRRAATSLHGLAFTSVLEACSIALPLALGDRLAILTAMLRQSSGTHFLAEAGGWAVVASIVILPAALVSGMQFPLLVGLLGRGDNNVGRHIGLACGWNTLAQFSGLWPVASASCRCSQRRAHGGRRQLSWRSLAWQFCSMTGDGRRRVSGRLPS